MPKLWNDTIDAHRSAVHEATLDATAALVAEHVLVSVTMSQIAKDTGIGRATLYTYFPDVDSILTAWHERQITAHLAQLAKFGEQAGTPRERLQAVLTAFAFISRGDHDADLAALMHRGGHVVRAQQQLRAFITNLIADAAKLASCATTSQLANSRHTVCSSPWPAACPAKQRSLASSL